MSDRTLPIPNFPRKPGQVCVTAAFHDSYISSLQRSCCKASPHRMHYKKEIGERVHTKLTSLELPVSIPCRYVKLIGLVRSGRKGGTNREL